MLCPNSSFKPAEFGLDNAVSTIDTNLRAGHESRGLTRKEDDGAL